MMALGLVYPVGAVLQGWMADPTGCGRSPSPVPWSCWRWRHWPPRSAPPSSPTWAIRVDPGHRGRAAVPTFPGTATRRPSTGHGTSTVPAPRGDEPGPRRGADRSRRPRQAQRRAAGALLAAGLGRRRPGGLLPASSAGAAVRRARRPAGRDRAGPVERHPARRRARPAGRRRRPGAGGHRRRRAGPTRPGAGGRRWRPIRWPGPCTTPRGPPGGPRGCGRGCGTRPRPPRPSPTRPTCGRSGPTTSTWSARRCTTRCRSGSPAGPCCGAEPA